MHELTLVQSLLVSTLNVAEAHGGLPVDKVRVRIGGLRQVVPDALQWAFDLAKKGTLAENAILEWEEVKAVVRCRQCSTSYEPDGVFWVCPRCGTAGGEAMQGQELVLDSVFLKGGSVSLNPTD
jgi:hydrogenase nickel incorporation protein HypA/HybF